MPLIFVLLLLGFGLSAPQANACKTCPANPIELSIQRSSAILLGTVESLSFSATEGKADAKRGPGQAQLQVQFEKWLLAPRAQSNAAKLKRGTAVQIHASWDGICMLRPALPEAGQRAIFFLAEWTEKQGPLTGYCSIPTLQVHKEKILLPSEAADEVGAPRDLKAFEKRLRKLKKD